ncbi:hypothetical protein D3C76_1642620 [compost metagenome]
MQAVRFGAMAAGLNKGRQILHQQGTVGNFCMGTDNAKLVYRAPGADPSSIAHLNMPGQAAMLADVSTVPDDAVVGNMHIIPQVIVVTDDGALAPLYRAAM